MANPDREQKGEGRKCGYREQRGPKPFLRDEIKWILRTDKIGNHWETALLTGTDAGVIVLAKTISPSAATQAHEWARKLIAAEIGGLSEKPKEFIS